MHTVTFEFKGKAKCYQAPRNWNQLTALQLIRWAAVAFGGYSAAEQLRLALIIAYHFEPKVYRCLPDHYKVQLELTVRFLFGENKLTRWLLGHFKIGFSRYYGPADALTNLTGHEFFNYTEVLYRQWLETKDERKLNALCAVLYRPKRRCEVDDDIRIPLTDSGVQKRAKRFESLHLSVKVGILLNYEGCRRAIIDHFPEVFDNSKAGSTKDKAADLVLALAGPHLGPYQEAKQTNLFKFLEHVTRMIQQAETPPAA